MRDDFPPSVKDVLAKRVGCRCCNPGCRKLTSGPHEESTKAVNIGVAAHITAAAPGGKRYNPNLSSEERRAIGNGIWLCQNCGKLIDSDEQRYSVELLHSWKRNAEQQASVEVETRTVQPSSDSSSKFEQYLKNLVDTPQSWWLDEINESTWYEFELFTKVQEESEQPAEKKSKDVLKPILKAIHDTNKQSILIAGAPGSGKSTLLEKLALEAAHTAQQNCNAPIPVLVRLKDYEASGERPGIRGLIQSALKSDDPSLDTEAMNQLLQKQKILLLIDGWNELSDERAKSHIKTFCKPYSVIVTSRNVGDYGEIQEKFEIQPLSRPAVERFFAQRLPNTQRTKLQELVDRVSDFGQTPLMVWMLFSIFRNDGSIPETRGETYRAFTKAYAKKAKAEIDLRNARELLGKLAFEMMKSPNPKNPNNFHLKVNEVEAEEIFGSEAELDRMLNHLLKQQGKLGIREISFCHQSLQEYYAAENLLAQLRRNPEWLEKEDGQNYTQFQQEYLNYPKWIEPIALMLALEDGKAQALRVVELALEVDLMLGARLAGEVKPKFQSQTVALLREQQTPELVKIHLLGATRSTHVISDLVHALLQHQNLTLSTDAAIMLWHLGSAALVDELLTLLKHDHYLVRANAAFAALGLRGIDNDRIISRLVEALQDEHEHEYFRESAARALSALGNPKAIPALIAALQDPSMRVREKAVEGLGDLNAQTAFDPLFKKILEDQSLIIQWDAARALGRIDAKIAIQKLLEVIKNENYEMCKRAAEAIEHLENEEVVPTLVELLENHNKYRYSYSYVYSSAAKGLEKIGTEKAVQGLIQALQHSDFEVCSAAIHALGGLGNQTVIPKLIEMLENPNPDVRKDVAFALGRLGDKAAIPELISFFVENQNRMVRGRKGANAARLLGDLGDKVAIPHLLKAFKESESQNSNFWGVVIGALGKLGCEEIIPELFKRLEEDKSWVQSEVIDGLASLNNQVVRSRLCKLLEHPDRELRINAAKVLSKLGDTTIIEHLRKALEDPDLKVRLYIMDALGALCDFVSLPRLWQMQLLEETDVSLLSTIKSIQAGEHCQFYSYEIFQAHLAAQKADRQIDQNSDRNTITIPTLESLTIMTDKAPIFNQQNATIGVNYAAEGSNIEFTQHINSSEQAFEILLTDYKQFIEQLQQKYSTLADPATVPQIIEVEAKLIEAQDQQRWQNFLNLKRLWNGSKKAGVKVSEHFAENNVWAKGAIAFLEGISEDAE